MPSTDYGRKLTPAEQAAAQAAIEAAPRNVWLITRRPLYPEARKRSGKARAKVAAADRIGTPA
jgi:hypothetical protein